MATHSVTSPIEQRKERWRQFLRPDSEPGFLFHVDYEDPDLPAPALPPKWPDHVQERVEWAWRTYEIQAEKAGWVDDDRVPYLSNVTGTEIFAEAFGCHVQRPDDTNPFAIPFVHTPAEADALRVPDVSTSSLAYLFDIADELRRRGGADVPLKPVDIQSPMDIVALIWDKVDLYIAMVESPEAVRTLAAKVRGVFVAFMDEWFRRYGTEYIAHYPDYFMSGGITLSEDEIGVVSCGMFDEFFRDELVRLSKHFGGIGIHCCADAGHQWRNLKCIPGLRLLNLVKPPTRKPQDYIEPAYPFFGRDVVQMHGGFTPPGPPETWPDWFPPDCRVVFDCRAENRDGAIALSHKLQEHRAAA